MKRVLLILIFTVITSLKAQIPEIERFGSSILQKEQLTKTNSLLSFLPETGLNKTEVSKVSSPTHLLNVIKASEIISIDYYQGKKNVSSLLATKTEGSIYNHSKICSSRR